VRADIGLTIAVVFASIILFTLDYAIDDPSLKQLDLESNIRVIESLSNKIGSIPIQYLLHPTQLKPISSFLLCFLQDLLKPMCGSLWIALLVVEINIVNAKI
jgi:hypothetical protein